MALRHLSNDSAGPRRSAVQTIGAATLLVGVALAMWQRAQLPQIHDFSGATMGSTWSVRVVGPANLDVAALRTGIEAQLRELDGELSGYRDASELSQLNRAPIGEWQALSQHLGAVIRFGRLLHDDSDGAFDLTVKPLVNLWGFGAAAPRLELPDDAEIAAARARLGNDRLQVSDDGARIRRLAEVTIDVDAIAPGYAADCVATWLSARGLRDHLVEVGGELRAGGHRPDGNAWRVGVERPRGERSTVERVVALSGGIASSGDYRVFVDIAGKRYSHTIDPATGRPVDHDLASVTVLADSGLEADGYATTLMVLGPERGMAWADARGLGAYMVVRTTGGRFNERFNDAFARRLVSK